MISRTVYEKWRACFLFENVFTSLFNVSHISLQLKKAKEKHYLAHPDLYLSIEDVFTNKAAVSIHSKFNMSVTENFFSVIYINNEQKQTKNRVFKPLPDVIFTSDDFTWLNVTNFESDSK